MLLGDCWFVSAASGIIQNYNLFRKVVPFDNSLEDSEYCGAFHFRFWIYGEWKDIVVDDYLPVGPDNKLIFLRNQQSPNEFWGPLLEKAYAKVTKMIISILFYSYFKLLKLFINKSCMVHTRP